LNQVHLIFYVIVAVILSNLSTLANYITTGDLIFAMSVGKTTMTNILNCGEEVYIKSRCD